MNIGLMFITLMMTDDVNTIQDLKNSQNRQPQFESLTKSAL